MDSSSTWNQDASVASCSAAPTPTTSPTPSVETPSTSSTVEKQILKTIECPVCYDPCKKPVLQCTNGHIVCNKCRTRLNRCPLCKERHSHSFRNLVAEEIGSLILPQTKEPEPAATSSRLPECVPENPDPYRRFTFSLESSHLPDEPLQQPRTSTPYSSVPVGPVSTTPELSQIPGYPPESSQLPGYPPELSQLPGYPPESSQLPGYPPELSQLPGYPPELSQIPGYPPELSQIPGYALDDTDHHSISSLSSVSTLESTRSLSPIFTDNRSMSSGSNESVRFTIQPYNLRSSWHATAMQTAPSYHRDHFGIGLPPPRFNPPFSPLNRDRRSPYNARASRMLSPSWSGPPRESTYNTRASRMLRDYRMYNNRASRRLDRRLSDRHRDYTRNRHSRRPMNNTRDRRRPRSPVNNPRHFDIVELVFSDHVPHEYHYANPLYEYFNHQNSDYTPFYRRFNMDVDWSDSDSNNSDGTN